jgi:hypothetical protein
MSTQIQKLREQLDQISWEALLRELEGAAESGGGAEHNLGAGGADNDLGDGDPDEQLLALTPVRECIRPCSMNVVTSLSYHTCFPMLWKVWVTPAAWQRHTNPDDRL